MDDKTEPSELPLNPGLEEGGVWSKKPATVNFSTEVNPPKGWVISVNPDPFDGITIMEGDEVVLRYKPEPMPADPKKATRQLLEALLAQMDARGET
jgi:hypothetical protein